LEVKKLSHKRFTLPSVHAQGKLSFGPFQLDLRSWELKRSGLRVRVQKQPLQLLALMLERPGELVTREECRAYLWPDGTYLDYEHGLNRSINKLRQALLDSPVNPRYIETLAARGYRFIGKIDSPQIDDRYSSSAARHGLVDSERMRTDLGRRSEAKVGTAVELDFAFSQTPVATHGFIGPCQGALTLDSPFYIERGVDSLIQGAVNSNEGVVLLKGARQTGKTSLLARVLAQSRDRGKLAFATDIQKLRRYELADLESFLRAVERSIADSFGLDLGTEAAWDVRRSASNNFERSLLKAIKLRGGRIVWGIDEADRVFPCAFASEFFGLLRAWHNERALNPDSEWHQLSVVISYATEAHLFITDPNQSPFNVGSKFELLDFTEDEIGRLNSRYGSPLDGRGISHLKVLLGGHPHLTQRAMFELASGRHSLSELSETAANEDGPFADHLKHLLLSLERCSELLQSVRGVLGGIGTESTDHFYRLRAFGVVSGDKARNAVPRCKLYRDFLSRHLL
jgi:DNA-binding winged helix-turn-helix (wHTH) protein